MNKPRWFKHDPEHTATGYRWLDWLTALYWWLTDYLTRRSFWKFMAVNESWREARDRTQKWWREKEETERLAAESTPTSVRETKEGLCDLCGELLPLGEEVFRYHGYSGPCPTTTPTPVEES